MTRTKQIQKPYSGISKELHSQLVTRLYEITEEEYENYRPEVNGVKKKWHYFQSVRNKIRKNEIPISMRFLKVYRGLVKDPLYSNVMYAVYRSSDNARYDFFDLKINMELVTDKTKREVKQRAKAKRVLALALAGVL